MREMRGEHERDEGRVRVEGVCMMRGEHDRDEGRA